MIHHGVSLTTAAFEVMKALKEYPNLQAINKAVIQADQKLIAAVYPTKTSSSLISYTNL